MIKVEKTAHGIECEMNGRTFDLLAETAVAVEAAAGAMLKSAKNPMTFEEALQHTVRAIYEYIPENRGKP